MVSGPMIHDRLPGAVSGCWDPAAPGVLRLPSGRLVRGRALRSPLAEGDLPELAVHLLGRRPAAP